jgi:hypothetical protein
MWALRVLPVLGLAFALSSRVLAQATPVIVLDDWWDVDYAKNACDLLHKGFGPSDEIYNPALKPQFEACRVDPAGGLNTFESDLAAQIAASPLCNGVQFARFEGPGSKDRTGAEAMQKDYWGMSLNYQPGDSKQEWAMNHGSVVTSGKGDPKEIAESVCSIASGRGGRLLN